MCRATASAMRSHTHLRILALLAACGGADEGGTAIGPGGGTVTSADGTLTMRFPPGAVAHETAIRISPGQTDRFLPGTAWQLEPAGLWLAAPVVVEMKLDAAWSGPLTLARATEDGRLATFGHAVTDQGVLRATLDTLKRPEERSAPRELGACPVPPLLEVETGDAGTTTVRAVGSTAYPLVVERAVTAPAGGAEPPAFAAWRTLYAGEIATDDTSGAGRYSYRAVIATPPCVGLASAVSTVDSAGEPGEPPVPPSTTITVAPMPCGGVEIAVAAPGVTTTWDIERSEDGGETFTPVAVGHANPTRFRDPLRPGVTASYRARRRDAAGLSAWIQSPTISSPAGSPLAVVKWPRVQVHRNSPHIVEVFTFRDGAPSDAIGLAYGGGFAEIAQPTPVFERPSFAPIGDWFFRFSVGPLGHLADGTVLEGTVVVSTLSDGVLATCRQSVQLEIVP
jgi:hypothetical protein